METGIESGIANMSLRNTHSAQQMLADTQTPITEIGYACGLEKPSYFGRIFRELTGYTHWNTGANGRIEIKNDRIRISSFWHGRYNRHCRIISDSRSVQE